MYWVSVWFLKPVFLYYTLFCGGFLLFYQNKVHLFTGSGDVRIQKNFSRKTQTVFKRFRGEVFCILTVFGANLQKPWGAKTYVRGPWLLYGICNLTNWQGLLLVYKGSLYTVCFGDLL